MKLVNQQQPGTGVPAKRRTREKEQKNASRKKKKRYEEKNSRFVFVCLKIPNFNNNKKNAKANKFLVLSYEMLFTRKVSGSFLFGKIYLFNAYLHLFKVFKN